MFYGGLRMKITRIGKDYITINEQNVPTTDERRNNKIHLIKLNFEEPTKEKILFVVDTFQKTNRYVISNNIRVYNDVLKNTGKKYYIENRTGVNLISYLRKNNKILLNFSNLREFEREFLANKSILDDVLKNVEVIQMKKSIYNDSLSLLNYWDGNVILED